MSRYQIFVVLAVVISVTSSCGARQGLDGFSYKETFAPTENMVRNKFQFDGYTDHWHTTSEQWTRYGNLFKTTASSPEGLIIRSKLDVAEDLGIAGLFLQEGFINALQKEPYTVMDGPSLKDLETALKGSNILVMADEGAEVGKTLLKKYPPINGIRQFIDNHIDSNDRVNAFMLENGTRKLFVVVSSHEQQRQKVKELINSTLDLLKHYDLKRGWFGAQTMLNSVTCTPGHPLEVIGKGMNEGNSWFVFAGYMDFLSKSDIQRWMERVKLPVATDVGFMSGGAMGTASIWGCENYDSLQVQSMFTSDAWIRYAHSKKGYAFRPVYDTTVDRASLAFDGYISGEGNKEQVDNDSLPFAAVTGNLESGAIPAMVLFARKGETFTKQSIWECILDRRAVAAQESGSMMGPQLYRHALDLLLLDRVFLEEYFGDRVSIEAETKGNKLFVTVRNTYPHKVSGKLNIVVPKEIKLLGDTVALISIPTDGTEIRSFSLELEAAAMNNTNPISVQYNWEGGSKSTLAMLDMPPVISVHQLLYGHTPVVKYPVTIHNYAKNTSFPVTVEVLDSNQSAKPVFSARQTYTVATGSFKEATFDLKVPPGRYFVKVTALGVESISQLGVGRATGAPKLTVTDLNSDGIDEYILENDSVKVTLLATGARVIEYIVKSKKDNVLFKLWPDKPFDDRRAFRKREFYPYGGFEDFLGQGSIETHKNYDVEVVKREGDYLQVKMSADYYGNKLEKIFTLYGNSPLLEIRFALTFKNPELKMLGPQPILALGEKHGPEDEYIFPEANGLSRYSADLQKYYGRIFFLKEGWNAGYDTKENISFVGAFPVNQPIFLHMWMNHPNNPGSQYFYTELQPWTRIYQKSTMYFSYYIWAEGGPWKHGVEALRNRHLITARN